MGENFLKLALVFILQFNILKSIDDFLGRFLYFLDLCFDLDLNKYQFATIDYLLTFGIVWKYFLEC